MFQLFFLILKLYSTIWLTISQLSLLITKYRNDRKWDLKPGGGVRAADAGRRSFSGTEETTAPHTEMISFHRQYVSSQNNIAKKKN